MLHASKNQEIILDLATSTNFHLYVDNNPINLTDPTGLAAQEKPASEASARAKELMGILPYRLDMLKKMAKETTDVERFGVILKAKDPKAQYQYKFLELISKDAEETVSPFKWWGSEKMHGALMLKPDKNDKVDIDKEQVRDSQLDQAYPIEFDWHTHPAAGDPWPSTQDGVHSKDNDMVGVMVKHIERMIGGKTEDVYFFWIVDSDGKTFEYKPPVPVAPK